MKEHEDFQAIQLALELGEIMLVQSLATQVPTVAKTQVQRNPLPSVKVLQRVYL